MKHRRIAIPARKPKPAEVYLPQLKMYAAGFEESSHGVEWIRFDADCPLLDLVKTVRHVAFEVDDLQAAIAGKEILIEPNSPSPGVQMAFIVENGAPIEFLEFDPKQVEE